MLDKAKKDENFQCRFVSFWLLEFDLHIRKLVGSCVLQAVSTNVSVAFWMYLPFLVQAPMRLTTLGWSPTLTMIFSSFKRSRFSSVVAFSAKQKETGNGNNIIGMYE